MSKFHVNAFFAGEEISELSVAAADYLIIYADRSALNITVGEKCYRTFSGQITIINTGNQQVQFHPEREFKGYFLQLNDAVSSGLVHRYLLIMNTSQMDVRVLTAGKQAKEIRTVFKNIVAEMRGVPELGETIMNLLLQELLVRLYRITFQAHSGIHSNRMEIVTSVCAFLEKEYNHPFTLESIAGEFNMSTSYLSHIFKEITGIPLMRYLLLVRVRAAQEYLVQTSMPVNEIAEKCGFNDLSNFGRTFRKETGCSPRQYRQTHLQMAAEK